MKDITHEILSEIHRLLSIATEEELRRVANLPNVSPHIRTALNSLANEKLSTTQRKNEAGKTSRKTSASFKHQNASGSSREIIKALEKLSKSQIQEACQSVGLAFSIQPKDARGRIIQRVANMVVKMTDDQRSQFLSAIRVKADTQTEGWVSVMRKGQ